MGWSAAAGGALLTTPGWAFGQDAAPPILPEAADADHPPTQVALTGDVFEHVTAPVMINGKGPFRFMVDTGANTSCVSQRLAETLELPRGKTLRVHTIVGPKDRASVLVDRLDIGSRTRRNIEAPILPMAGFGIDGVLGIDWLKGQRLVLGFAGKTLEITRSKREDSAEGKVVVPARRKSGQLTIVDADLSGRKISAMIDSGSQFSLGNSALRRIIERADPTARSRVQTVGMLSIAGERFTGEQLNLPFIRLGGLTLGNVPVVFSDLPVFKLWDLHDSPTIMLGIDLLAQFTTVSLDFGRSAVRFDLADEAKA
ncbi:retroviral-like aspartic protease family protein [Phenylobacterium sp.]|uniref:retroviral-like aspartic protease family protein n=1 Tax=Phenylobacterium sp. TaxID=1871053 RepID=UPI0027368559|nr:retroviral-like aspartic protease family protein [Phenylobacterium sp.]MDP3854590.1 retroviral-like aspartic protease family protein [Phenylobacterium sp.]